MNCPKCGKTNALHLFSSILCTTNTCSNFDESWANEVLNKAEITFDDHRDMVTTTTNTGAFYLGDASEFDEGIFTTYTDVTSYFYFYFPYTDNEYP
jgi:hypothetical protein